jgi:hypothetical protein
MASETVAAIACIRLMCGRAGRGGGLSARNPTASPPHRSQSRLDCLPNGSTSEFILLGHSHGETCVDLSSIFHSGINLAYSASVDGMIVVGADVRNGGGNGRHRTAGSVR